MKRDHLYDRIHRTLNRDPVEPASESFYDGVWRRIQSQKEKSFSVRNDDKPRNPFGVVCWKAVPVFGVFLLVTSLYLSYYPADSYEQDLSSVESFVLDTGEIPTNDDLLYQILYTSDSMGLEKNP